MIDKKSQEDLLKEYKKNYKVVDLFPYKIKNVNNFINRNHPVNLHPSTSKYKSYWKQAIQYSIEGKWVNDEGTYVWMMPKLWWYINIDKITITDKINKSRLRRSPDLADSEWIMSTYMCCSLGFSGFREDPLYSCNMYLLDEPTIQDCKDRCNKQDTTTLEWYFDQVEYDTLVYNGKLKTYKSAWEYLRTYMTDKPLGIGTYYNESYNYGKLTARGQGKMLLPTAKIRVKDGWTTMEDVQVGDKVYNKEGRLYNVISKTDLQEDLKMFKLTLRDGREIEACEDHLWEVFNRDNKLVIKSTKELFEDYWTERKRDKRYPDKKCIDFKYSIPNNKHLKEETEKELAIHPYVMGCLLGDGSLTSDCITFTTADLELVDYLNKLLPEEFHLSDHKDLYSYGIISKEYKKGVSFRHVLEKYKLNKTNSETKFIPHDYIFNNYENKMELLRGLMDTDGFVDKNGTTIEYYTVSKQLSDGFQEICRSLGIPTRHRIKKTHYKKNGIKVVCKPCHRITLYTDKPVFKLKRKLDKIKLRGSNYSKSKVIKSSIINIEPIGLAAGYCIEVDAPDKTYLTDNYIVTHNSFIIISNILHEWCTGGVKYFTAWQETKNKISTNKIELFLGAAQSDKTNDLVSKLKTSYDELPGTYDNGQSWYPSPFFKNVEGSWSSDSKKGIKHSYKSSNGISKGSQSKMKFGTFTTENPEGAVGLRASQIVIEEVGLLGNFLEVHSNNVNSLEDGIKFGMEICLGTSGSIDKIQEVKKAFYDPDAYEFYGIPNYWENESNDIWLFVPALYKHRDCKDVNGNTDFDKALMKIIKVRERKKRAQDLHAYEKELMFNPIVPAELFISAKFNLFPKVQLAERVNYLEQFPVKFDTIELIKTAQGVQMIGTDKVPIQEFPMKESTEDKEGAIIVYEHPIIEHTNRNLYKIVYDPVLNEGEGTSLASVLVYKDYHSLGTMIDDVNVPDNSFNGTIVAEWVGRYNLPEHNHEQAFMLTEYYQGLLYPETNVGQITTYARNNRYTHLLGRSPKASMAKDLKNPNFKYDVGVKMNKQLKDAAQRYAKSWFLGRRPNGETQIDNIYSLRLLREALAYDGEGNFDHISSLFILMFVINNSLEQPVYQIKQARAKKSSEELFEFMKNNTTYASYI